MGKHINARRQITCLILTSLLTSFLSIPVANAATVIATGTDPTACNQTVDNASNVIAYRLAGGQCVVEFKNVGTVNWTVPNGVTSIQVLTVGGGGGGGGGSRVNVDGYRGSGGGGEGGEAKYAASYSVTGGASAAVIVGNGGTSGAANNASGGFGSIGGNGGASSFNGANSSAGGVGGGAMTAENQLNSGGDGGGLIGSCNSSVSQSSSGSSNNYFAGCNDFEGSGGGAGAGGNGGNGSDIGGPGGNGGAGGVGLSYAITDATIFFGGGGGGGGTSGSTSSLSGSAGVGGNDGGGGGSIYGSPSPATSGTSNRGGGGGGGAGYSNATQVATSGGAGGSGIVIIRYTPLVDTTPPTISTVSSTSNGSYKAGDVIDVRVTFSETVTVTGTPRITLETGATDRVVNYSSGSGSTVLVFNYTVQAGDTSSDLDYVATNSLALNGGTIADVAGNNATLTLASPGASGSLGNSKAIVIDTTAPTFSSAVLNSAGTQITLTYSETLSTTPINTSRFTVSDSGTAVTVSSVPISGSTITLVLGSVINSGRVVTLSYTDPTVGDDVSAIQDFVGNDAASLSSQNVTNNSTVKSTPTFSAWSNVTKTFGDANYTVTAPTVTGSLAGSFSYGSSNTGVISISSSTFTVAGGGSATITATFTPTDTVNFNSASTTNTVTVNKAAQSAITITTTAATYGSNLTLVSTGGSTGGTYNYTKVSGTCTLSGAVLTPTAPGSCVVQSNLATTANYLAETSTATTITIASGSVSASLTLAPGNFVFRQAKLITAVSTVAGKITFRVAGKILPGCKNKTVNAGNSFTTTCSYRPSNHSIVTISATLDPTDSYYTGNVTSSAQYLVSRRTGPR